MPKIAVITDSDASLPVELAAHHNIQVIPMSIHFGKETLQTGIDIDEAALFARVDREGKIPSTSAPTPGQFADAYQKAFDKGAEQVLCFCVSGAMSIASSAANAAKDLLAGKDITVVDTQSLSMGQGFMTLAAAELAETGASKKEILAHVEDLRQHTQIYATIPSLRYLALSGRVKKVAAGMAGLLNIRPILTLSEGQLKLKERTRTQRKSWAHLVTLTEQILDNRPAARLSIIHSGVLEDAQRFAVQLNASVQSNTPLIIAPFTAALAVHAGPGLIGVVVVTP